MIRQETPVEGMDNVRVSRGERAKRAGLMLGLQLFAKDGRFLRMFSAREIKRRTRESRLWRD